MINTERNKQIVNDFLFEGKTLQQLGNDHNISKERIRQILEYHGVMSRKENSKRNRMTKVYDFLIKYKTENDGNTPTFRTIIDETKLSTHGRVSAALDALEKEGFIEIVKTIQGEYKRRTEVKIVGGKWIPPEKTF